PLDPVFGGLTLLGARMERHGAPAHPGSLLFLARWQDLPVLGMPTCGMFSQATTFDLVLPRLLAGEVIGNQEIAALGHGGLLSREMACRFPPYRAGAARAEAAALGAGDVLGVLQADVRPTRMRCVTLPITVLAKALG